MKANELRIGNIVTNRNENIVIIHSINNRGINLEIEDDSCCDDFGRVSKPTGYFINPEYTFDKLRGIPLTEEILHKVGLEVGGYMALEVTHQKYPKILFVLGETFDSVWHSQIERKYLHELQNLFFALTGEELDVTELLK